MADMETAENHGEIFRAKVNLETAQITWKELQRYFASGVALSVAADLDLVEVACQMSRDNAVQIRQWMASGKFGKVTDGQAAAWLENDTLVWAVVVSPWVLVQPVRQLQ
ncbi:MAG: DUF2288 domain-containing protein [Gallionella sp.]